MPTPGEKIRDFKADLEAIDQKNIDYFLFERQEKSAGKRDKLKYHYSFLMRGEVALFGFLPGSAVPMRIRKQCFVKFDHYFPDGHIIGGIWSK